MAPETLSSATFDETVADDTPTLVDFHATWCGPCHALAPVLEHLADAHGDELRVVKVDVDANPDLAMKYEIMGVPTVIVFRNGNEVDRLVGVNPGERYLAAARAA